MIISIRTITTFYMLYKKCYIQAGANIKLWEYNLVLNYYNKVSSHT